MQEVDVEIGAAFAICIGMLVTAAWYEFGLIPVRGGWYGFGIAALNVGILFALAMAYYIAKYCIWDRRGKNHKK